MAISKPNLTIEIVAAMNQASLDAARNQAIDSLSKMIPEGITATNIGVARAQFAGIMGNIIAQSTGRVKELFEGIQGAYVESLSKGSMSVKEFAEGLDKILNSSLSGVREFHKDIDNLNREAIQDEKAAQQDRISDERKARQTILASRIEFEEKAVALVRRHRKLIKKIETERPEVREGILAPEIEVPPMMFLNDLKKKLQELRNEEDRVNEEIKITKALLRDEAPEKSYQQRLKDTEIALKRLGATESDLSSIQESTNRLISEGASKTKALGIASGETAQAIKREISETERASNAFEKATHKLGLQFNSQGKSIEETDKAIKVFEADYKRLKDAGFHAGAALDDAFKRAKGPIDEADKSAIALAKNIEKLRARGADATQIADYEKEVATMKTMVSPLTAVSEAFKKVNASGKRVTEAQRELNKLNDITFKLKARGMDVSEFNRRVADMATHGGTKIQHMTEAFRQMTEETRKSSSAFINFGKHLLIGAGIIGVFMRAGQMLAGAVRGAFGLAEAAAKLEDTEKGFRAIASQTTNASLALIQIRQAAGGVIDDMTLLGTSTRAALSGLPVGTMPEIVESARALASVTGRDVPDAIDRMVNAAAKQERKLLDELGVVVRANDLYEDYARKHNLVASAMSATQKQAAFLEGMLTAVRSKVQSLGGVLDEAQKPFLRLNEATRNWKLTIGEVILSSVEFKSTILGLTDTFNFWSSVFESSGDKVVKQFSRIAVLQKIVNDENEAS